MFTLASRIYLGLLRRLRYFYYKNRLAALGVGTQICRGVIFGKPEDVSIGVSVIINDYVVIQACEGAKVIIGDGVHISYGAKIITGGLDFNSDNSSFNGHISKSIKIGKNSWLGANSLILPGVTIGENAVIAAGTVVTKDVDHNVVVAGVPAKPITVRGLN